MDAVEEIILLVKAAQREGDRQVNAALRPLGLTSAQAEVLLLLAAAEPLSLTQLGSLLVAEGGHPSRLVERLVTAGYVVRTQANDDRRRLELRLTPAGRQLAERAAQRKHDLHCRARQVVSAADLEPLRAVLEAYLADGPWAETVRLRRRLAEATRRRGPAGGPGAAGRPLT